MLKLKEQAPFGWGGKMCWPPGLDIWGARLKYSLDPPVTSIDFNLDSALTRTLTGV